MTLSPCCWAAFGVEFFIRILWTLAFAHCNHSSTGSRTLMFSTGVCTSCSLPCSKAEPPTSGPMFLQIGFCFADCRNLKYFLSLSKYYSVELPDEPHIFLLYKCSYSQLNAIPASDQGTPHASYLAILNIRKQALPLFSNLFGSV